MSEFDFRTVAHDAEVTLEEKRSEFIAAVRRVETESEAEAFVKERRRAHPDARHTVFAYLLNKGTARYSDDAEPQGTAGMPILETIRRSGLSDVIVVVTRYFGGILLGAGGLTRAYAGAAAAGLAAAGVSEYAEFVEYTVTCSYADHPRLQKEMERQAVRIRDTVFDAEVHLSVGLRAGGEESFLARMRDISAGRALVEEQGRRRDVI